MAVRASIRHVASRTRRPTRPRPVGTFTFRVYRRPASRCSEQAVKRILRRSATKRVVCRRPGLAKMSDTHTFVCYAHENADFVRALTADLKARGLPIWLDADIAPGVDWDRTIDERLRACLVFLIVLSPAAV